MLQGFHQHQYDVEVLVHSYYHHTQDHTLYSYNDKVLFLRYKILLHMNSSNIKIKILTAHYYIERRYYLRMNEISLNY